MLLFSSLKAWLPLGCKERRNDWRLLHSAVTPPVIYGSASGCHQSRMRQENIQMQGAGRRPDQLPELSQLGLFNTGEIQQFVFTIEVNI